MATEILRPNADVVNAWSKSSGTTSWGALDDAVTDPTDASTSGDGVRIFSSTAGQESEVAVATFTLGTDTVSAVRAKVFAGGGAKRGIDIRLLHGATQLGNTLSLGASAADAWYTITYTGSLTQAQIDDLRIEFVCVSTAGGGGASAADVFAAYVEVDHAGVTVFERSAAISAVPAITAAGTFWSVFERSASLAATAMIASAGEVAAAATVHERSASLSATAAIESSGIFFTVFECSATVGATAAIEVSGAVEPADAPATLGTLLTLGVG